MNCRLPAALLSLTIAMSFALTAPGQNPPETITVKATPFYLVDNVEARVESKSETAVKIAAEKWTQFRVESVVAQGTSVKPGDQLIAFDATDIGARLKEAKFELDSLKMDLDAAAVELEFLTKLVPIDEKLNQRMWEQTQQDAKYFFEIQKPMSEREVDWQRRSSEYYVENAQEELDQLKKMYDADHLTEESEKIVLKRAERSLEQAQFYLEQNRIETARQLEVEIPRSVRDRENALERGRLEFEKKSIELPRSLQKKELEYAKLKFAFERKQREHDELLADSQYMKLTAPVAGTVYHGQIQRGILRKGATPSNRLIEPGDDLAVKLPVLTLVDTKNLQLRCDLDQKQRASLKPGATVLVSFDDRPEQRFEGSLTEVGQFPLDDGKFDGIIQVPQFPADIIPGMTCRVKVVTYKNDQAIMVPKSAVFTDDGGLSQYVYIMIGETPQKRPIVALREHGEQLEVTQGLAAGDKILKSKPE